MGYRKIAADRNRLIYAIPVFIVVLMVAFGVVMESSTTEKKENRTVPNFKFTSVPIPDSVSFAGERMPLDQFDVREALDRELLSNAYFHSQTIRYIKLAPRYFSIIEPILKEKGIPDDFKYLAVAESGFNPRAESPANAIGFWQFLKSTAQDYGLEINSEIDERYNVQKSTYAACDYLNDAYDLYGSWTMVAASYNAGMNGVNRQIVRQKTENYYDLLLVEETQRYVYRIVALKLILENPGKYNFKITDDEKYPVINTRSIEINGPVADFTEFATENGVSYKLLKDFNPWLRDTKLTNTKRKTYEIRIPVLNE